MASIFKNRKIKENLESFEIPNLKGKIKLIQEWYDFYYKGTLKQEKEITVAPRYSQLLIDLLGYKGKPVEAYTIESEPTTEEKGGQRPDLLLGHLSGEDRNISAVVELKAASVPLDRPQRREGNMSPIQQAFKYKPQFSNCSFVIASNFYEIRLFQDTQLDYEIWTLDDLLNPEDNYFKFRKFYYLLCAQNFVAKSGKSKTEELLSDIRVESEKISKKFYKEYHELRTDLLRSMYQKNQIIRDNIDFGIEKAQKIIDRVVFVCFCEDTGLLPEHTLKRVLDNSKDNFGSLWSSLQGFFEAVDKGSEKLELPEGYNGGLFSPDNELRNLVVDDKILSKLLDLGKYDFSEDLTVNILGHIFEQSISDLEEIKQKVEIDKKINSKRKKDGIFYTPDYIVDYIVKNSLGKYLEEKEEELKSKYKLKGDILDKTYEKREREAYEEYQAFLQKVKVLDPACGSGAFLVKVFDYLLAENQRVGAILGNLFGIDNYNKHILKNNIYGVDLNQESVEITKLSLWLKTAQKNKKLTVLDGNIKCGNSLIDDVDVAGDKAFDWDREFKEIMGEGGFDVVVGNPPYVRIQGLKANYEEEAKYYEEKYTAAVANYDIYVLFMEKGFQLLKKKGELSFILPHKFLISEFGKGIRKYLLEKKGLKSLLHFGSNMVFEEASTYTCILNLSHNNEKIFFKHLNPKDVNLDFKYEFVDYSKLTENKWNLTNKNISDVLEKLNEQSLRVNDVFAKIFQGIATSGDDVYLLLKTKNGLYSKSLDKIVEIEDGLLKPMLKGDDISRYRNLKNKYFVIFPYLLEEGKASSMTEKYIKENFPNGYRYLKENEKFLRGREHGRFNNPKEWFLFSRKQGISEVERLKIITPDIACGSQMSIDDGKYYHGTTLYSFIKKDEVKEDYKFYLTLLNSSIMWFFIKNTSTELRGGYFRFKTKYLEPFPLPKLNNLEEQKPFIAKADIMLDLNKKMQNKLDKFSSRISSSLNLEKLSNKLKKFYELDFVDFIKELKKKKVELSLKDQDEWDEYFNDYKKEVLELKSQIDKTDKEIDQMVYDLYGLTKKEVGVVEGEVK